MRLATQAMLLLATMVLAAAASRAVEPTERFVPAALPPGSSATLRLLPEARVVGQEVQLRQIARWSAADAAAFEPVADLVLTRLSGPSPSATISMEQFRQFLHDAGVNLASVRLSGATQCVVVRGDAPANPDGQLRQGASQARLANEPPDTSGLLDPLAPAANAVTPSTTAPVQTLRQLLLDDLAARLNLPVDRLEVRFADKDQAALRLSQPPVQFSIDGRRIRDLGQVQWEVAVAAAGQSQKLQIAGEARAWQRQVVAVRPLAAQQVIRAEDVVERTVLVSRIEEDPLLKVEQVIGQRAARAMPAGTVFTARTVEAVPLVHTGQLVTVTLQTGQVQVTTVAEARHSAAYGQVVRVRKPGTREEFEVVMTGPQTARLHARNGVASAQD